jgi:hypothetical protein
MEFNINGQKSSKKNNTKIALIVFTIIFFDVIVKFLSQGALPFFIVLFAFFLFYIRLARPLKRQKWNINSDFAFQNRADEDIPPSPNRQGAAVSTIRTKHSDLEEVSWSPAAENYTKEDEDENSESYWRNRESKKISSGKMLMDMGSPKREEGGRFK